MGIESAQVYLYDLWNSSPEAGVPAMASPQADNPSTKKAAATSHQTSASDVEFEIRRRAYELYEERGREEGHALEHWLRAEEEITHKRGRAEAA